ncbi:glycosyltransferase family 10 [Flavobacterium sp. AS60]|uniref:glycosyltransferase family 10 domain-containing protein n=1 Tax=Flavobacterium anseongense TaxID=2910677 RepID=UPI001F470681|nr:glycosyltransferase family 10 [Flavobacterium sp. AS60]MCF6129913.1 glycosyltransferase family 10 [Flavobacterium sp. AS60]
MKIVKLSFGYDFPIFRQTPKSSGEWGNYKFVIDNSLKECDFWVVFGDYKFNIESVQCNPENIIFIPGECYETSTKFLQEFLNQFGLIITVQREIKHRNCIYTHNANPWFIGKSYDELVALNTPEKTRLISVVSSNKVFTAGHKKRLDFVKKLKNHFGDQLDVFGRGIKDFDDKWDVLANYKYSIAIENDNCDDWVTEKLFDCLYAHTLPFYYGCPNLDDYVNKEAYIRIDINNFEESVKIIEEGIKNNEFEKRLPILKKEAKESLNTDNFFPFITKFLDDMDSTLPKEQIIIKAPNYFKLYVKIKLGFLKRIQKLINKKK